MKWISEGLRLLPFIVGAVHAVESLVSSRRGQEKQDAAVDAIRAMLGATEAGVGRDLLDDREVELATRATIDAYVHLQNVVNKRRGAAGAPTGGSSSGTGS